MRPLSLLFICLVFVSLNVRMQSSCAEVIKVPADTQMLQLMSELNEPLKAMWLRQPEAILAKTKDHPIEINYSVNSLCAASDLKILKSSNFPDVDREALRAVSNIPVLKNSHFHPYAGYNLSSTFSNNNVKTELIGVSFIHDSLPAGDWNVPDMPEEYSK